jgi:hypothetical protein
VGEAGGGQVLDLTAARQLNELGGFIPRGKFVSQTICFLNSTVSRKM